MRASELTNKSVEELQAELLGLLREQFSLRVQYASGQLNQTHQIRNARRNIARVKTVLNKKVGA